MNAVRIGAAAAVALAAVVTLNGQQQPPPGDSTSQNPNAFKFKSGVELVNVTATVSDPSGRFVGGLRQDDFVVYEDDQPQQVTHFSSERVPVSLGIVLDTSGSMAGEKIESARSALDRFLFDLLDPHDELFMYRFSSTPVLLQGWTTNRELLSRALGRITPNGETAMYDSVAEAVPMAGAGQHQKKAILVISDGNDTSSRTPLRDLKQLIRENEVLVYAIGIDSEGGGTGRVVPRQPRFPMPIPLPFPGGPGRGRLPRPMPPTNGPGGGGGWPRSRDDDRVNVVALRDMTDDSGGRTEIVRDARDLNPATGGIADELSKQYYLGYMSTGKRDGRWHSIRVEVRDRAYRVRARRGYVAS